MNDMSYGTLRPAEHEQYAARVAVIAAKLHKGATVVVKLTARGTEQQLIITKVSAPFGAVAMHTGPEYIDKYLIVGRFEHGLYVFHIGRGMNAPGYVASKLGIVPVDAEILAALLDDLSDALDALRER